MKNIQKFNFVITFYLMVLVFLQLSVVAVPLFIHWDLAITHKLIIEEEVLETALIVILFGTSYFILRRFKHTLNAYEQKFSQVGAEKSQLLSRLTNTFRYIGTVNVERQEINAILCNLGNYPRTKKELRQRIEYLATRAMTIAKTPWLATRIIDRNSKKTISEYTVVRPGYLVPASTMGNREILENMNVSGLTKITSSQENLALMTVCILPKCQEKENILLKFITKQIEMSFLLYHTGFLSNPLKDKKNNQANI